VILPSNPVIWHTGSRLRTGSRRCKGELLIDCEEGTLRAVLVGMLREADR
jgi:hypothetical protein